MKILSPIVAGPFCIVNESLEILWEERSDSIVFYPSLYDKQDGCLAFFDSDLHTRVLESVKRCIFSKKIACRFIKGWSDVIVLKVEPFKYLLDGRELVVSAVSLEPLSGKVCCSPDEDYFKVRWGFSSREAKVAVHLMSGESLRDISTALSLSIETVRWYQKSFCGRLSVSGRVGFLSRVYADVFRC